MLSFKSAGIVLRLLPYNDKYRILKIYTRQKGLISVLQPLSVSRKTQSGKNSLYPVQIVELEATQKQAGGFVFLRDAVLINGLHQCLMHPVKRLQLIFIQEVLYRILTEEEPDPPLFDFLCKSLEELEGHIDNFLNFHLIYLARLTKYLGIQPINNYHLTEAPFFQPQEGKFGKENNLLNLFVGRTESEILYNLFLSAGLQNVELPAMNGLQRKSIANTLVQYFSLHLPHMKEIQSINVLSDTLHEM